MSTSGSIALSPAKESKSPNTCHQSTQRRRPVRILDPRTRQWEHAKDVLWRWFAELILADLLQTGSRGSQNLMQAPRQGQIELPRFWRWPRLISLQCDYNLGACRRELPFAFPERPLRLL